MIRQGKLTDAKEWEVGRSPNQSLVVREPPKKNSQSSPRTLNEQITISNARKFRQLTWVYFRRQEAEGWKLETTFVGPVVDRPLIYLPCEHEWFIDILVPRSSYFLVDPIPFPLSPNAVRPPTVHATPDY